MKKNFYNICRVTIFCLMASALICAFSNTVFAAENKTAGMSRLFTISYNGSSANGAAPSDGKAYVSGSVAVVMDEGELSKSGSKFAGWSKVPNGTSADYVPGDTIEIQQSITLYAVWTSANTSEPAAIISNSGTVSHTPAGSSYVSDFPDRTFVSGK